MHTVVHFWLYYMAANFPGAPSQTELGYSIAWATSCLMTDARYICNLIYWYSIVHSSGTYFSGSVSATDQPSTGGDLYQQCNNRLVIKSNKTLPYNNGHHAVANSNGWVGVTCNCMTAMTE